MIILHYLEFWLNNESAAIISGSSITLDKGKYSAIHYGMKHSL